MTDEINGEHVVVAVRDSTREAGRKSLRAGFALFGVAAVISVPLLGIPLRNLVNSGKQTDCRSRIVQALDAASAQLLVDQAKFVLARSDGADTSVVIVEYGNDITEVERLAGLRAQSVDLCSSNRDFDPTP